MTVPINADLKGGRYKWPMTNGGDHCLAEYGQISSLIAAGWTVDQITIDPGYCEGATAYTAGTDRTANPNGSDPEKTSWINGWQDKAPTGFWDLSLCGTPGLISIDHRMISQPYIQDFTVESGSATVVAGTDAIDRFMALTLIGADTVLSHSELMPLKNLSTLEVLLDFDTLVYNAGATIELRLVNPSDNDVVLASSVVALADSTESTDLVLYTEDHRLDGVQAELRVVLHEVTSSHVTQFLVLQY